MPTQPNLASCEKRPAEARPPEQALLSLAEAAKLLSLTVDRARQMAEQGILPGTRASGEWRFPKLLVEKWQREQLTTKQRSAVQKIRGLDPAALVTSTESYDLSIIDELDLPGM